jgi:hypothetical protein
MEVILRQAVDSLGHAGDLVKVSSGYARNFLLPRGMALPATDGNKKRISMEKAKLILPPGPTVEYVENMQDVPKACDAVAIATEWPEFGKLDWASARPQMIAPILFDGRNLLDRLEMESLGYLYKGVGR